MSVRKIFGLFFTLFLTVNFIKAGDNMNNILTSKETNIVNIAKYTAQGDMTALNTALNNGLIKFPGVILFASRDHQIVQTTANRIMEILPNGRLIDKITTYDEYLESDEMARKRQVYSADETVADN